MMITYTLIEEDIKLAIKNYCLSWLKNDQTIDLSQICLNCEIGCPSNPIKIFSATATPTKVYKD